jgi:hypothetical protein
MYGNVLGMSTLLGPRVGRSRNTNTAEMGNRVFTAAGSLYTHYSVNQIQRCRTTHRSERDRRHRDSNVPNSRCKGVCQRSCQCIHSDTLRYKAHERWRPGEFMACPRSQKWFPTLRSRSFQTPAASRLGSRLVEVSRRDLIVLVVVPLRSAIFSSWRLIPPRTWSGAWAA